MPNETRKIIQITTAKDGTLLNPRTVLFALCDDGTLWFRSVITEGWQEADGVPEIEPLAPHKKTNRGGKKSISRRPFR